MIGTAIRSRQPSPRLLDREIEAIARALAENGPMERRELARRVRAGNWGPGRFADALVEAELAGRVRRLSRTTYGPANRGDGERRQATGDET
jgi:hypothetical protein